MNYIVVDLEWNQPLSFDTHVYRQVGDRLIFEMIQIGAVKVGENFEVIDSISIPIKPTHYVKIHPRIRKLTQLGKEELEDALAKSRKHPSTCTSNHLSSFRNSGVTMLSRFSNGFV